MERLIEISKKITELLDEANSLRPEIPNTPSIHFDTLESLEKNYFILNQINIKIYYYYVFHKIYLVFDEIFLICYICRHISFYFFL